MPQLYPNGLSKNCDPFCLFYLPYLGCYFYASTDEILNIALDALGLSKLCQTDIPITQGDIMEIDARGRRTTTRFDDAKLRPQRYFFGWGQWGRAVEPPRELDDYMETVLEYGQRHGVPEAELRLLMDAGYDAFDIEQLIYDHGSRESCIREIIDDLGVERSTEYAMEQMFSVIDARYRSGKPLIVTTNLKLDEIKHPPDLAHARIYDRILERCVPILFAGKNFREENADGTKSTARKIITDSK